MRSISRNPGNESVRRADVKTIRDDVISIIASSTTKISPSTLEKQLAEKYGLSKKQIKAVIRDLVSTGELIYTYEYGHTFLEQSFAGPVRISKHVVFKPPGLHYSSKKDDVVVQLKPGAAFGDGRHPTTRLAVRGIEYTCLINQKIGKKPNNIVLDIGTGSGVLVLTAVLCGLDQGIGIDIDPCARVEAAENVKVNGLENRIVISGQSVETLDRSFSLVIANLRYPSLINLVNRLTALTEEKGIAILSGIKDDEMADLLKVYTEKNFKCLWTEKDHNWAGVVMQKLA